MFTLRHRRDDGSFVVNLANGLPYHVTSDDPLFTAVSAAAQGVTLEPEPVPEPAQPTPPLRLPHFKFRVGLAQAGLLEQAEATIAALPIADPLRIAWDARADVLRDSNLLSGAIAAGLITEAQFDAVWTAAAAVP